MTALGEYLRSNPQAVTVLLWGIVALPYIIGGLAIYDYIREHRRGN